MAIVDRLKSMVRRQQPASRVGARRPSAATPPADTAREDALRAKLVQDPNDAASFAALADLVRRRARDSGQVDPLTAPHPADRQRAANLAVWSLAEELAGNPRAWYPLIELARLSLADDHEAALRRLHSACERDSSGRAVAEGVRMLREANFPSEALGLGVGHWAPQQHIPEAGRHIVLAALDVGRTGEARRHLNSLSTVAHQHAAAAKEIKAQLEPLVSAAEEVARNAYMTETGTVPAVAVLRTGEPIAPTAHRPAAPPVPPGATPTLPQAPRPSVPPVIPPRGTNPSPGPVPGEPRA